MRPVRRSWRWPAEFFVESLARASVSRLGLLLEPIWRRKREAPAACVTELRPCYWPPAGKTVAEMGSLFKTWEPAACKPPHLAASKTRNSCRPIVGFSWAKLRNTSVVNCGANLLPWGQGIVCIKYTQFVGTYHLQRLSPCLRFES